MKIKQQGFSLIELLVVLAIMSVIAGVAYPSYVEHVRKSKRADAKVALQKAAQQMETHYMRNNYRYSAKALNSSLDASALTTTISSPEGQYDISLDIPAGTTPPNSTYTLSAVAKTTSTQAKDLDCYKFVLDNTGQKTAMKKTSDSAVPAATTGCW